MPDSFSPAHGTVHVRSRADLHSRAVPRSPLLPLQALPATLGEPHARSPPSAPPALSL